MPLILNLGISKKIGQPAYGSLGASCNVAVELDQSLIFDDPAGFQQHVQQIFAVCRQAVQEELAQQQTVKMEGTAAAQSNGQSNSQNGISPKQVDFAHRLAGQIRGLGVRRLDALAVTMFNKPLVQLSSFDGSALIDVLRMLRSERPSWVQRWISRKIQTEFFEGSYLEDCILYVSQKVFIFKVMTHKKYDENKWQAECGCFESPPKTAAKGKAHKKGRWLMAIKSEYALKGKSRDSYLELVSAFPLASIKSEKHLNVAQKVMDQLLAKIKLDHDEEIHLEALKWPCGILWGRTSRHPTCLGCGHASTSDGSQGRHTGPTESGHESAKVIDLRSSRGT
jgi:hypothetical protein